MTEFSTEYHMGWVGQGDVPLPAQSRAAMAREDAAAQREAEREAARSQDRAEATALAARVSGRVRHGLGDVFAHALRQMSADDYTAEREELQRNATEWTGEPPPRPRLWTDDQLAAEAGPRCSCGGCATRPPPSRSRQTSSFSRRGNGTR